MKVEHFDNGYSPLREEENAVQIPHSVRDDSVEVRDDDAALGIYIGIGR